MQFYVKALGILLLATQLCTPILPMNKPNDQSKEEKEYQNWLHEFRIRLHMAIELDDMLSVKTLIENVQLDPDMKDFMGQTPLMHAVELCDYTMANYFLRAKADPNKQGSMGKTALMLAAEKGYVDIVRLFLQCGADPNMQDIFGNTALIKASSSGHPEVVELLLQHGAKPNILSRQTSNINTMSALLRATGNTNNPKCREVIKILLNYGAEPNIESSGGALPLTVATQRNDCDVIKTLLHQKADPLKKDKEGKNAWQYADDEKKQLMANTIADGRGKQMLPTSDMLDDFDF